MENSPLWIVGGEFFMRWICHGGEFSRGSEFSSGEFSNDEFANGELLTANFPKIVF